MVYLWHGILRICFATCVSKRKKWIFYIIALSCNIIVITQMTTCTGKKNRGKVCGAKICDDMVYCEEHMYQQWHENDEY